MKTINPLFVPLKNIKRLTHTHTESVHNGQLHRMNTYQVWQKAGMRQKIYSADELADMYDQCEEFWKTVESRLMTVTLLVDPTYIPRRCTMASAGDKLSDIRHNLRMAIRGLWKAYATKNWQWVSSYYVQVNRQYLTYRTGKQKFVWAAKETSFKVNNQRGAPPPPRATQHRAFEISTLETGFSWGP